MKQCSNCKKYKEDTADFFRLNEDNTLTATCLDCLLLKQKWAIKNKQRLIDYQKQYREGPARERRLQQKTTWRQTHKEQYTENLRRCHVARMTNDPLYKLRRNLRKRLAMAIKSNAKGGSAVKDLGCTIQELKTHLESQFKPGMTWDNYGEWHIDHKKPLADFDLTNPEHIKIVCHYTNLQPLWAKENLSKGTKC